jgi:predicted house-cleaning noncanonical NTP pyrophosphatase (MazG superfamily)
MRTYDLSIGLLLSSAIASDDSVNFLFPCIDRELKKYCQTKTEEELASILQILPAIHLDRVRWN